MWFTDGHPPEDVTPENQEKYSKGMVGDELTIREEKYNDYSIFFVDAWITVTDKAIKNKIDSGINQVSLGYRTHWDFTPGTFAGVAYDVLQIEIENNHTALEPRGRAGSKVKIKSRVGDLNTAFEIEESTKFIENKEEKRHFMIIKGKTIVLDAVGEILVQQELDEKNNEITALKTKVADTEALKAQVFKLTTDLETLSNIDYEAEAEKRQATVEKAKQYIKDSAFTGKGLKVAEIEKKAVMDAYPGKDFSEFTEGTFSQVFKLLDAKPAAAAGTKPLIRDSFTGIAPFQANVNDADTVINSLVDQLVNAGKPAVKENK
jgi:hypothetical protein